MLASGKRRKKILYRKKIEEDRKNNDWGRGDGVKESEKGVDKKKTEEEAENMV